MLGGVGLKGSDSRGERGAGDQTDQGPEELGEGHKAPVGEPGVLVGGAVGGQCPARRNWTGAAGRAGAESTASFLSRPQGAHLVEGSALDAPQAEGKARTGLGTQETQRGRFPWEQHRTDRGLQSGPEHNVNLLGWSLGHPGFDFVPENSHLPRG